MAEKLWGGRFTKKTNKLVEEFTHSIHFDQKLAKYDVLGSLYHIDVLKKAGLLTAGEHKKLKTGLEKILAEVSKQSFKVDSSCLPAGTAFEDIHSFIQHRLEKEVGEVASKLHTCRSRNDQVVLDTKMYSKENLLHTQKLILEFEKSLKSLAQKNKNIILPGMTHLQHAIPVSLENYLGAYTAMLKWDFKRLENANKNIILTFGAGALAGTFIEASKYKDSKFEPTANSIDSVSSRDFVIEILSALAIIGMHLSRLAEDMILWVTKEFDFIDIDDAFCTGSSLMPQKKNPDVLELIRGYSGRLYGNLVSVLVMMKGLPLSYNRDMQLDKEPLFNSFEIVQKELEILAELFKNVTFKKENIDKQLEDECLYATDLADYLVQNKVPFKDAHHAIGQLIQYKLKNNLEIRSLDPKTLKTFHPLLTPAVVKKIIDPEHSVKSKKSMKINGKNF